MVKQNKTLIVKKEINLNDKLLNNVIKSTGIDFREIIEASKQVQLSNLDETKLKFIEALQKLKNTFKDTIPSEFFCPITTQIFFEPVIYLFPKIVR